MLKTLRTAAVAAFLLSSAFSFAEEIPPGYPSSYSDLVAASKNEGGALVYSIMAAFNWKPVLDGFSKKYPWIKVETLDMANELWDRYNTEKASGGRTADLIVSFGIDRWNDFVKQDEAEQYSSPETQNLPDWAKLKPGVYGLSADPALIVWNKRLVPESFKFDSMAALSAYAKANAATLKGKLTTYDSASGTVAASFNWLWSTMHQEPWNTLTDLTHFTKFERSGGAMLEKVTSGEYVAAYLIGAIAVYTKINEPARKAVLDWSYVTDGQPLLVRAMAVTRGGKSPASAKLLLDYILSKEGQIAFAKGGLTPVRLDIADGETPFPTVNQVAQAIGGRDKLAFMSYDSENVKSITAFVERWKKMVAEAR